MTRRPRPTRDPKTMRMAFSLTPDQIRNRIKTETRRRRGGHVRPGDTLIAHVKGTEIARLLVTGVHREELRAISPAGVQAEGFPGETPQTFIDMFCLHMKCTPRESIYVIRFCYLEHPEDIPF